MLESGRSELGIFRRIFGKCRGGYRDKTLKVRAGGLKTYLRLLLTKTRPGLNAKKNLRIKNPEAPKGTGDLGLKVWRPVSLGSCEGTNLSYHSGDLWQIIWFPYYSIP